jgi:hypothetical protein
MTANSAIDYLEKSMVTYAREAEVGRDEEETMAQQVNHQLSTADKIYVFDINFYTVFDIVFNTVFDTISDTTVFDTLLLLWSF